MTALEVLTTLHSQGVTLTRRGDRVRVEAPAGTLSEDMRQAIRTHKGKLLALLEAFEERAAIAEYCGGLPQPAAAALAWQCVLGEEAAHAVPVGEVSP